MNDFEKAFGNFIDRPEYDQAEASLFSIVRISFKAGWLAAGGKAPEAQNVIKLIQPKCTFSAENSPDLIKTDIYLDDE